jgi:hypothetical protein
MPGDDFAVDLAALIGDPELARRVRDVGQGDELIGLRKLYVLARSLLGVDDAGPTFPSGFIGCLKMLLQVPEPGASFAKAARSLDSYSSRQLSDLGRMLQRLGLSALLPAAELAGQERYITSASREESVRYLVSCRVFEVAEFESGEAILPTLITLAGDWDRISEGLRLERLADAIKIRHHWVRTSAK